MCHGNGVKSWPDGRVYTGDWHLNQMHGQGHFIYADKSEFTGEFVAGKRHGAGKYKTANGITQEGNWSEDMK